MGTKRVGLARTQALIQSLKRDIDLGVTRFKSTGTVPTIVATTAGDGTCTIAATSTDVAGTVTFADTWANSDTLVITFNKAYATAPKVLLSSHVFNASGANVLEFDAVVTSTTSITITASGTCVGAMTYFVIETV